MDHKRTGVPGSGVASLRLAAKMRNEARLTARLREEARLRREAEVGRMRRAEKAAAMKKLAEESLVDGMQGLMEKK